MQPKDFTAFFIAANIIRVNNPIGSKLFNGLEFDLESIFLMQ